MNKINEQAFLNTLSYPTKIVVYSGANKEVIAVRSFDEAIEKLDTGFTLRPTKIKVYKDIVQKEVKNEDEAEARAEEEIEEKPATFACDYPGCFYVGGTAVGLRMHKTHGHKEK